ncbi:MAG: MFS transporter [Betaproteobacteria bacterium]|jgi:MFS family permease
MSNAHLRDLLAQRQFIRFWLARLGGVTANQMLMMALAWHVYDLTGSAWDLGLVGLFQFVPALLMTLPAGHLADRWHRGRIFAVCLLTQAVVALVLVLAVQEAFVSRDLILALSVVLGAARAFQMPAQQALVPLLVPQALLTRAIALSSSGIQIAIIGGPALGGLLYLNGPTLVYATAAGMLTLSGLLTLGVRYRHQRRDEVASWHTVLAGVGFVWQRKVLLGAISLDLFAVLLGGATALLPIYARDILHTGPQGLGLLRAAPAAGALLMSLLLMRWPLQRYVGRRLLGAVALFGVATLVFGLSNDFVVSLLALAVSGAADSISVVTRLTLVQLETPDAMRGRVAAVNSIFVGASNQLGEFESGATADMWGPVGSVVAGGLGTVLVALVWWRLFPALAQRDRLT